MIGTRDFRRLVGLIAATWSLNAGAEDPTLSNDVEAAPTPAAVILELPAMPGPEITPAPVAETMAPEVAPPLKAPAPAKTETATAEAPKRDPLFPRYRILEPNIAFWTKVFSEYSEDQSAIHSIDDPGKVFEVLDFRDDAARMGESELARWKSKEEGRAKKHVDRLLERVHEARYQPETLEGEERRLYRMFPESLGDNRFRKAIGSFRAQRGLRERTRLALETSGKYLPEMEAIFKSYGLPVRLTRLPLVESSFNVEAYSKVGAAGLWQFIPASARIYMRMNEVVDDRRDPWTSTDAAARHLRDDYEMLRSWPLALTAYNHGRGGVARGLIEVGGTDLPDLIRSYKGKRFGFASRNFYAEFLAASDVEREWRKHFGEIRRKAPVAYEVVETKHYVPYETLRKLCDADDEMFRKLNPAYRPEVIEGKLYVPPGHLIRVPAGRAQSFAVAYSLLGDDQRFEKQRVYFLLHKVKKGEVVSRIAKRYGVSANAILKANGLGKKSRIRAGKVLKIPPREERRPGPVTVAVGESKPGLTAQETEVVIAERVKAAKPVKRAKKSSNRRHRTHRVKSGQTLTSIARTYKVSIKDLRRANGLGSSSFLKVGQRLKIPS